MTGPLSPSREPVRWRPATAQATPDENPVVRCPHCKRTTNADMLLDVRVLPEAVRTALKFDGGDFACDACVATRLRTRQIDRATFAAHLGAPAAVVQRARELDQR